MANRGHVTNLPNDRIVEIPGCVDRNGLTMTVVGNLPLACAASVRVQQLDMEAAARGDVTLLKQAMLHDPLVDSALPKIIEGYAKWQPIQNQCPRRESNSDQRFRKTSIFALKIEGLIACFVALA